MTGTKFARKPVWAACWGLPAGETRPVRHVHHDGQSFLMTENQWYDRLAELEFEKRGHRVRYFTNDLSFVRWTSETEAEIQKRLQRIEPVTRKQARKEGWKG